MSGTTERLELLESEEARVFAWRYETLLRAGLEDEQATVVALADFDLHRALGMLSSGCSPEQLAMIVE